MEFTNNWFDPHIPTWNRIVPQYNPSKILEVGSNEGRSICHVIALLGSDFQSQSTGSRQENEG